MILPLFVMPRRRLLPTCDLSLHVGRPLTFRRFEKAYSSGGEIFVATSEGDGLRRIGVVARIITLSHIPSERPGGDSEDRAVLRGIRRASVDTATPLDEQHVDIIRLDENAPRALDEATNAALARLDQAVAAHRESFGMRGDDEVDQTRDPISRLYRTATYEGVGSWTRTALLEAEAIRRKAEILEEALLEEVQLRAIETRILARL